MIWINFEYYGLDEIRLGEMQLLFDIDVYLNKASGLDDFSS